MDLRRSGRIEWRRVVASGVDPSPATDRRWWSAAPRKPTGVGHRSRRWQVEQPHPGVYLWRSPHGYCFLVTNQGTQALGPLPRPEADTCTTAPATIVELTRRLRHRRSS